FVESFWHTGGGKIFVVGTLIVGLLAPLAVHLQILPTARRAVVIAAVLSLVGGFFLRYGLLTAAPQILKNEAAVTAGFRAPAGRAAAGAAPTPAIPPPPRNRAARCFCPNDPALTTSAARSCGAAVGLARVASAATGPRPGTRPGRSCPQAPRPRSSGCARPR